MSRVALAFALVLGTVLVSGQSPQPGTFRPGSLVPGPARRADEGRGPFKTLVIRGAILIDGTGAPPVGPVDIVVANNRIQSVRGAGTPGLPLRTNRPPQSADHE